MLALLATLVFALPQREDVLTWIPRKALVDGAFDHATRVDARGSWIVAVQEFPERTLRPMAHRPDVPWRVVRQRAGEVEELASSNSTHSGWGAPSWLCVDKDGTVVASWRPGHEVLRSRPGEPGKLWSLHDNGSLECAALTTDWIVHWERASHELSVTPLGPEGAGARRQLAGATPPRPDLVACDGTWLAWVEPPSTLCWIAVAGGEPRELQIATDGHLEIDGLWSGVVLLRARFGPDRVHMVALESGARESFEVPAATRWITPEGAFTDGGLYDPLDGSFLRCESAPALFPHAPLRAAPGRFIGRDSTGWFELSLHSPRAPVPPSLPKLALPQLPTPLPSEAAHRSLWLSLRAH